MWGNAWCHKKINFCHSFFSSNVTSKLRVFNILKANKINIKHSLQKRNFKVLFFESQRSLWGHAWCLKKFFYWLLKVFAWIFHLNWKKIFQVTQWPQNSLIKSSRYLWDTLYISVKITSINICEKVTDLKKHHKGVLTKYLCLNNDDYLT